MANAAADADVSIGASAKFTIADGTTIDPSGQQDSASTIPRCHRSRVVTTLKIRVRFSNLMKSNEVDLVQAGVVTRKYTLLSGDGVHGNARTAGTREVGRHPQVKLMDAKAIREVAEKKAALPSAKRRQIWSVTLVLTALPHGHCQ